MTQHTQQSVSQYDTFFFTGCFRFAIPQVGELDFPVDTWEMTIPGGGGMNTHTIKQTQQSFICTRWDSRIDFISYPRVSSKCLAANTRLTFIPCLWQDELKRDKTKATTFNDTTIIHSATVSTTISSCFSHFGGKYLLQFFVIVYLYVSTWECEQEQKDHPEQSDRWCLLD